MSKSTSTAAHGSKLEEQAKAKGDISYSYWASTDKPANSEVVPKKLSDDKAAELQQGSEQQSSHHGASAWNSAGTFEERAVTDWAKQQLEQAAVGISSDQATITGCTVLSGDAHMWFIRGKKRHGFEFEIELTWQLSSSSSSDAATEPGRKGTIKLPSASPDELDDLHMEVSLDQASGDAADAAALQAARSLKQPLEEALTKFYAELKQK